MDALYIDGSAGEGGGQVLRSSLTLSMATGIPFRIDGIRAGRKKPGLMRQHLTAVQSAARLSSAEVVGAELGATSVEFRPRGVTPGTYEFSVGTAGSTSLVLQTLLVPLCLADGPSRLTLRGGTHNPWAPPFDYLAKCFRPIARRLGLRFQLELVRYGFFPAGGGEIRVSVEPADDLRPLRLTERGAPGRHSGQILLANLSERIGESERKTLARRMGWDPERIAIETVEGSAGPGNLMNVTLDYANVTEIVTAFGERGLPAKRVATDVSDQARQFLGSQAAVGVHLADQLMLPLALCKGGEYTTLRPSRHARTNAEIINLFLGEGTVEIREEGDAYRVEVRGRSRLVTAS